MKEKFPTTKRVITLLNVLAVLVVVIGGMLTIESFRDASTSGILIGLGFLVGTIIAAILPAFLAELLNILLEIENNTRKDNPS